MVLLEMFHLCSEIKRLNYLKKAPLDVGLYNQQSTAAIPHTDLGGALPTAATLVLFTSP